jgi:hypothetical protein
MAVCKKKAPKNHPLGWEISTGITAINKKNAGCKTRYKKQEIHP